MFDLGEVRKLRNFARMFHCTVYFACLNPEGGERSGYWVHLDQLGEVPAKKRQATDGVHSRCRCAAGVDARAALYGVRSSSCPEFMACLRRPGFKPRSGFQTAFEFMPPDVKRAMA